MSQKMTISSYFYKNCSISDASSYMSSMVKIANKINNIGLLQEKSKQRGWEYTFLKIPWNFWICYFTLRNSEENKLSLLEILQNGVTPLRNFKAENQDPWELHNFFLYTHGNFTSFLIDTLNFHMFNTPGNSMSSSPTPVWSLWNEFWPKNLPKSSLK